MIQANKNGFLYVVDRTNCSLIAAHPFVKVNWASRIDMTTGRPVLTDVYKRFLAGEEVEIWPSRGTNAVPIAFNPQHGSRLCEHLESAANSEAAVRRRHRARRQHDRRDITSAGGEARRLPSAISWRSIRSPAKRSGRSHSPISQFLWNACDRRRAGVHRQVDRRVHRSRRGDRQHLWQFKTGSSINSTAITYTYKGRQYVSIASGLGGGLANRYAGDKVPDRGLDVDVCADGRLTSSQRSLGSEDGIGVES